MSSSSQEDVERVQVLCTDFQDRYLWRMIQHENGACDAQRIDTYNGVGTTPKHFSRCPSKNACVAALQTAADGS